jgi:peptidoglycan/LPS O-acetylase OafA/YrhL
MPFATPMIQKPIYRSDIQALRTLAVSLVVVFHLWPYRLSGGFVGVDVFFVISGFLITSHILRDVESEKFSVVRFWAKRIRRLLPASFLVLIATAIAVVIYIPVSLWAQWLREIQASVLYIQNWKLAADAVDYLALANSASPTQHFWSLSVEEQFYFVWPILVAIGLLFTKKFAIQPRRRAIFVILASLSVGSLFYGIYLTATEPAIAYFSTPVRAWEFGAGALVAFAPSLKHRYLSPLVALLGIGSIIFTGFLFEASFPFPGAWALIPVLGTVAVIWAAANSGWLGKLFSLAPVQWFGEKSYSIYLWHWPLIILVPYMLGQESGTWQRVGILLTTVLLAWLTTNYIEKPFMASGLKPDLRPRTIFIYLGLASTLIVGFLSYSAAESEKKIAAEIAASEQKAQEIIPCFGAAARAPAAEPCSNPDIEGLFPSIDTAPQDRAINAKVCKGMNRDDAIPKVCKLGVKESDIKIAMIGDSHMGHYSGAITGLAKKHNWELELYYKGGCPFSDTQRVHDSILSSACEGWVQASKRLITESDYDLVITSQASGVEWQLNNGSTQTKSAENGLVSLWRTLNQAGLPVVAIKDNPRPITNFLKCLTDKSEAECLSSKKSAFKFDPQVGAVATMKSEAVMLINFDDVFCDAENCFPVIGNVIVFRGDNHLTNTFTKTLAPYIEPYLLKALGEK